MHNSVGKLLFFCCLFILSSIQANAQNWANDFVAIDQHARKSPRKLHKDLPALTEYLCKDATSELEKVRAIYSWITTHIGYDWKAIEEDKRINHFIKDILEREVALCFGYAQLFAKMCELAEVECEIINGYAKGTTGAQLPLDEPNHSWNAVKIRGEWYLLDATWGSSTISQENNFVLISNDDYFLIRPEQFARTHLPGNPMWQLLTRPVSVKQFMESELPNIPEPALDTSFRFRDSLATYFALSTPQRNLFNYERTYAFYATKKNGELFGHSLIDYAGILSDTLEQLPESTDPQKVMALHEEVLTYCRRAQQLISFYPWQQELFVSTLINQAVLLYNHQGDTDHPFNTSNDAIIAILEEAQDLLADGKDSYFNRMARQQCASYLEVIRGETR